MAEKEVKKVEDFGLVFGGSEKTATVIQNGTKEEIEKAHELLLKALKVSKTGGYLNIVKL